MATSHTKFKADPYNFSNTLITTPDVIDILRKVNINDFQPTNISLYQQAFIHTSYNKLEDYKEFTQPDGCLPLQDKSYEILEFLGDSLLGCMTAEYLYVRFEGEDEGFMTKIKTRIVNGEQLCYLATQLDMNKHIIISKHIEEHCSGRNNQHILEDVLEAFIGALYLDCQDYKVIQTFVFNLIECHLDLPEIILNDTNFKDQILRYFQHNFKVYPSYRHKSREDSDKDFTCELLQGDNVICIGVGKTKKKAEQNASYNALVQYNVLS
jgi:ribonuclease-3